MSGRRCGGRLGSDGVLSYSCVYISRKLDLGGAGRRRGGTWGGGLDLLLFDGEQLDQLGDADLSGSR